MCERDQQRGLEVDRCGREMRKRYQETLYTETGKDKMKNIKNLKYIKNYWLCFPFNI